MKVRVRIAAGVVSVLVSLALAACDDDDVSGSAPTSSPTVSTPAPTASASTSSAPSPSQVTVTARETIRETVTPDSEPTQDEDSDEPTSEPSSTYEPSGNIYLDVQAIYIDREQYSDGTCGGVENVIARNKSDHPEGDIYYVHYSGKVERITSDPLKIDYSFTAVVTADDYLLTKLDYDNGDFGFLSEMDECDEDSEIHPVVEVVGKTGQANHRYDGFNWRDE